MNIQRETSHGRNCNTTVVTHNKTTGSSPEWADGNYTLSDNFSICCSNMIEVIGFLFEFILKGKENYKPFMDELTYIKTELFEYCNSSSANRDRTVNNTLKPLSTRSKFQENKDTLNNDTRKPWDYAIILNFSGDGIMDMAEAIIKIFKYSQASQKLPVKSHDSNLEEGRNKNEEHVVQNSSHHYGIIAAPTRGSLVSNVDNDSYAVNRKLAEDNESAPLEVQERSFRMGSVLGDIVSNGTDMVTRTISQIAKDTGRVFDSMTDRGIRLVNRLLHIKGPEPQQIPSTQKYGLYPYLPIPVIIKRYVQRGEPGMPEYLGQPGIRDGSGYGKLTGISSVPGLTRQSEIPDVPASATKPDGHFSPGDPERS
jgi:hypothetical protein